MINPHSITAEFEKAICEYTSSPYCVAVDNCSNALYLSLLYWKLFVNPDLKEISIPKCTYPAVPCEIIRAGYQVVFTDSVVMLGGEYRLGGTKIYDSALRFTADMYTQNRFQCLSFTGPYKHLKLGKGGAILTDNEHAYKWLKKARFSGRSECSYHEDNFDDNPVIGMNCYLMPEIAARGLQMMAQFYDIDGNKKHNEDLSLKYPDLSTFNLWKK